MFSLVLPLLAGGKLATQRASVADLWADHGSGSAHDVTVYSTTPPAGYLALSDYAQVGYPDAAGRFSDWATPYGPPIVVRETNETGGLLAQPASWTKIYSASAAKPFDLWRPVAPAGYLALGDVGTTNGKEPPAGTYATVHESCVASCAADVMLWGDKEGKLALFGASGDGVTTISAGGLLADVSYPTGPLVAQQQALCLKASCIADTDDFPEQIHIALGFFPSQMAVQWATAVGADNAKLCTRGPAGKVVYGLKGGPLSQSVLAECTAFSLGSGQLTQENWNATLVHLKPSELYEYQVVSGEATSDVFSFRTAPDATTLSASLPHQFVIYGDLGHNLPASSSTIMPYVARDILHGPPGLPRDGIDMLLHVGDFAYDFDSSGGAIGRKFMNDIQNYSANVPYMISHGNHESGFNFAHCTEFFRSQPINTGTIATGASPSSPNNWWFSWNYGLVHFVAVSTEIFFDHPTLLPSMLAWLDADLAAAQANRTLAPWIIVHGHRPCYCSCDGDCDAGATTVRLGLEPLFFKYGVDFFIVGHEHNYERMYDVAPKENAKDPWLSGVSTQSTTDMPATTYIVVGSAGNQENHEPFTRDPPPRTALALNEYGYGRMLVHNASHLQWQFVVTDGSQSPPKYDVIGDEVMYVQHKHGPFADRN